MPDMKSKEQELTGYLDREIGFPLESDEPDYDKLAKKFFDKFFAIAEDVFSGRR